VVRFMVQTCLNLNRTLRTRSLRSGPRFSKVAEPDLRPKVRSGVRDQTGPWHHSTPIHRALEQGVHVLSSLFLYTSPLTSTDRSVLTLYTPLRRVALSASHLSHNASLPSLRRRPSIPHPFIAHGQGCSARLRSGALTEVTRPCA
jgi:hypothetical protein